MHTHWLKSCRALSATLPALLLALFSHIALAQGVTPTAALIPGSPSIMSGEMATFRGIGFLPGELVTFQVAQAAEAPVTGNQHRMVPVVATADGSFRATWQVCSGDCLGKQLIVEATGQTSGRVGRASFLDLPTLHRGTRVRTDKTDYAPGSTAHLSGFGFQAGEAVVLEVHHADGTPDTGAEHAPWTVFAGADGGFASTWHVCTDDCLGSTLRLTAAGQSSGRTAHAIFTDAGAVPSFERLKSFGAPGSGASPYGGVIVGADGALYGTTSTGGPTGNGSVYRINPDGSGFTQLKTFNYSDGATPWAALVQGADGTLYGSTVYGGDTFNGTLFRVNPDGSGFSTLLSFDYFTTGANPFGALAVGSDGALYGTASGGGANYSGTVFRINTDGTGFTVLQDLAYGTSGYNPMADLLWGTDGRLYGSATSGGSNGGGTLFSLNPDGSDFAVLQAFGFGTSSGGANGLIEGTDGALYGTALWGGASGGGTVFKLNKDGSGFTVLQELAYAGTTGSSPFAGLRQGTDGKLYGTAAYGGGAGYGTVFRLNTDGSDFGTLQAFDYTTTGGNLRARLAQGADGTLFSTAVEGGVSYSGTIFRLNADGSGFSVIKHLSYGPDIASEGGYPWDGPMQATNGAFYGANSQGGSFAYGTLFKLNADGSDFTLLGNFDYPTTGGYSIHRLIEGTDGVLYGTAGSGGSWFAGTAFKVNPDGTGFAVIKEFDFFNYLAALPTGLLQGSDGALYGATQGTLYTMNRDGSGFTLLHVFNYADGSRPNELIQGPDGTLYGTASYGGSYGYGNVFKMNTDGGDFTVLHEFDFTSGAIPSAGLVLGSDGALYGTTNYGGTSFAGNVFKLNTDGSNFAVLVDFDPFTSGSYTEAGLVLGADGALYGTTPYGGSAGFGTVFRLNQDGSDFSVIENFGPGPNGSSPVGALALGTDGNLYGAARNGGDAGAGTLYRLVFSNTNNPPVARCKAVTVPAGTGCIASASIDDGSSDPDAGDSVTLTQSPAGPYALGTTNVLLTVTDSHGAFSTCSASVTVSNPPPVASITGPASGSVWAAGTPVSFSGSWTDANGGAHTAQWTFDGTPDASFPAGSGTSGSANTSHTFTVAGVYMVQLKVTDDCGASATTNQVGGIDAIVVVYDPSAGFVTGGGWIPSPAGAYVPDPSLTGKANFGFVSRYKKGTTIPTGETEFQFKAGSLDFHSTSYDWLVVSGVKAQYKGSGTINGAGSYAFMITGIDGDLSGGGGVDKFRMKITNKLTGLLVYDNQLGAPESSDPTAVLGGGAIVIQAGSKATSTGPGGSASILGGSGGSEALPIAYELSRSSPNPFEQDARLGFSLPERSQVRIAIFDVAGREVRTLVDGEWEPGRHSVTLSRTGSQGRLHSGIYFVRMTARSLTRGDSFTAFQRIGVVN